MVVSFQRPQRRKLLSGSEVQKLQGHQSSRPAGRHAIPESDQSRAVDALVQRCREYRSWRDGRRRNQFGSSGPLERSRTRRRVGAERHVRASLIRWMCVDPDAVKLIDPKGIRVMGARITGGLNLAHVRVPAPGVAELFDPGRDIARFGGASGTQSEWQPHRRDLRLRNEGDGHAPHGRWIRCVR